MQKEFQRKETIPNYKYTLYIINRKLEFSNSKTKVKVSPINGMPFPIGLVYINNDLKK
jgi:hypothetical protein